MTQPKVATTPMSPPLHLSAEAKKMYATLASDYAIEDSAGLTILGTACEAFDSMRAAQAAMKKTGRFYTDGKGIVRQHPGATAERDARTSMLRALKALNLDLEPLHPRPGRPSNQP